jgi:hypothetical protein
VNESGLATSRDAVRQPAVENPRAALVSPPGIVREAVEGRRNLLDFCLMVDG